MHAHPAYYTDSHVCVHTHTGNKFVSVSVHCKYGFQWTHVMGIEFKLKAKM